MIASLGDYATEVLSAYAVTFVALGVLVGAVVMRSRRVRAELQELEGKGK